MPARTIAILSLLLFSLSARAQYRIEGTVTDQHHQPVPDAGVILMGVADSTILKTALTDGKGAYALQTSRIAGTLIRITAARYKPEERLLTDTASQQQTIHFTLTAAAAELAGVTVSGRKPLFERRADRTVFNVGNSITAIGSNALEAVQRAPGVTVSAGGNTISLAGKSEVQVMVNGRLLQLSGEDLINYLQAVPAANLERIEVITTPPAQYDAAGNAGLINLVLKKNPGNGLNGDVRLGYEQAGYGKGISGAGLNFRKNRLDLYANAAYNNGANDITERLSTPYPGQEFRLTDHYRRETGALQYTAGADYELHQNGILGVQLTGSDFRRTYHEEINARVEQEQTAVLDSLIRTDATSRLANHPVSLNLNYDWKIDSAGKRLTLNANRFWFRSDRQKDLDTRTYAGADLIPMGDHIVSRNAGEQEIRITTAQADVALPYAWATVSFGGKLSYVDNVSQNQFFFLENGAYVNDTAISNAFHYSERVQALYLSAQRTAGKWELQAGLRGEWTRTEGYSYNLNQTNTNRYFNLFPTAYAQYKFSDDHVLNLTYSKRVERPGYRALDPFRAYSSPYSYVGGNPFLQPSYAYNAELNYLLKGRYTFTVFYQLERQHFGMVFLVDTLHQTQSVRWENYGDVTGYGGSAMASLQPAKWWELQAQAGAFVQEIRTGYYTGPVQAYRLPTGYIIAGNSLQLNKAKTLSAEINASWFARAQSDLLYLRPRGSLDAGVKALLMHRQLILSLNATDILATDRTRGVNEANGQVINSYFDARNVRLMVQYKFGNRKVRARRERSTGIEEERSRT